VILPGDRQRALAWLASQFDGVRESGGNNRGTLVERFQRAVDGKAEGEPWCLAFVMYCLDQVDELAGSHAHLLPRTEATQLLWNSARAELKTDGPEVGAIIVWRSGPGRGHCGIVTGIVGGNVETIEGNTGGGDQRDGDGVFRKRRINGQIPGMQLLGYLRPWGIR
jgi:hypothetical protein